jgi:hypothetical protein
MERKTLKLALDTFERMNHEDSIFAGEFDKEIIAINEALAQPEQEPVGKFAKFTDGIWHEVTDGSPGVPLYTAPPQQVIQSYSEKHNLERPWVDLTDEQIKTIDEMALTKNMAIAMTMATLKELNHD